MLRKQWILREQNTELAEKLAAELNIRPVIAQVLVNRGITTVEAGRDFFGYDLADTPDPFLMLGMKPAVKRINKALAAGETIVIYGDYDADGQTATSVLVRALRELASDPTRITYYLPDRFSEGYGLNKDALTALSKRASLLISVDCGISSYDEIEHAKALGLDVIITDHHEPAERLPAAVAILNPKQKGCEYPYTGLAGVGVALKLVQGLGVPQTTWMKYLDLVALGTVADLVPLQGENRILVKQGLRQMAKTENVGLRALLESAQVNEPTASDLGFRLGPRLNAAGRLGDSTRGVRLLLTEDPLEARELASQLTLENAKRQQLEAEVLAEAIEVVERHNLSNRGALVVWGKDWHQGVIGIVASRLVEKYYLPTVVVSVTENEATASARSISGLDLYETLGECAHFLTKFGGHAMAAGLSLPIKNLHAFQQYFEKLCTTKLSPEDYVPKLHIDVQTTLEEVTDRLIEELSMLEPHGLGNPAPVFQAKVSVLRSRSVGAENRHLQLTVQDVTAKELPAIAFGAGPQQNQLEQFAEGIDLAFVPGYNEWRGEQTIQLRVKAWQAASDIDNYVRRWTVDNYPWRLGASYYQSIALRLEENHPKVLKTHQFLDLRGIWDQAEAFAEKQSPEEPALILVNSAASVLEVCRELRIRIGEGSKLIGFEHELMNAEERKELEKQPFKWLVTTGYKLQGKKWPAIWLWEPPLTAETFWLWSDLLEGGGQLAAVYGPKEVSKLQSHLVQNYPDRRGLARIYSLLRSKNGRIGLASAYEQLEKLGMLGALPVAVGIFSELGLWQVDQDFITYLPTPDQKLDLEQAVLYNKVTKIRKQSTQYLKRCLERGFFQDGLKREN